jgi:hypothetical protein
MTVEVMQEAVMMVVGTPEVMLVETQGETRAAMQEGMQAEVTTIVEGETQVVETTGETEATEATAEMVETAAAETNKGVTDATNK